MSKRAELRERRLRQARQRQMAFIGGTAVLALAVIGYLIYANTRPLGEFVTIEKAAFPHADGKALGLAEAPATILVFSDFQCPFCQLFATSVEKQLIDDYVAAGEVRLEYRHYIVVDGNVGGSESRRSAEASECASAQGDFWNYHDMLFANQQGEGRGAFSDRRLKAFADALGYNTSEFNGCFDSRRYASQVQADEQLARTMGVDSTPTVFVNSTQIQNPLDLSEFQRLIEAALAAR
jgi:protein-disulfide isomerase